MKTRSRVTQTLPSPFVTQSDTSSPDDPNCVNRSGGEWAAEMIDEYFDYLTITPTSSRERDNLLHNMFLIGIYSAIDTAPPIKRARRLFSPAKKHMRYARMLRSKLEVILATGPAMLDDAFFSLFNKWNDTLCKAYDYAYEEVQDDRASNH